MMNTVNRNAVILENAALGTRPTIVHLLDFVPNSQRSMESFLLSFAEKLNARGWQSVFVFSGEPSEYICHRLKELKAPYYTYAFPLSHGDVQDLGKQLLPYKPCVLQTHFLSKFHLSLRKLKKLTGARCLIVTDHSSGTVSRLASKMPPLMKIRAAFASTYIDRIICVSDFVRRRNVSLFFPEQKVCTVYNGVDTGKYSPVPFTGRTEKPVFTIAFAGQLIPEKGILTLLQAVKNLSALSVAPFEVLIAGKGPQGEELKQFCDDHALTQVRFLGQVDKIHEFFASSDLVVVPSVWEEAFGLVAVEAMACGTAVLTSTAGGLPEVTGDVGFVFQTGDADDLTAKLRDLLTDPAQCFKVRPLAREWVARHFSLERMVEGHLQVIGSMNPQLLPVAPTLTVVQT